MILYHKMKAMGQPRCMGLSLLHIQFCSIYILQHSRSRLLAEIPSADRILNSSQYYLLLDRNCLKISRLIDLKSTFLSNGWLFILELSPAGCGYISSGSYRDFPLYLIHHSANMSWFLSTTSLVSYSYSPLFFFPSLFSEERFSSS